MSAGVGIKDKLECKWAAVLISSQWIGTSHQQASKMKHFNIFGCNISLNVNILWDLKKRKKNHHQFDSFVLYSSKIRDKKTITTQSQTSQTSLCMRAAPCSRYLTSGVCHRLLYSAAQRRGQSRIQHNRDAHTMQLYLVLCASHTNGCYYS